LAIPSCNQSTEPVSSKSSGVNAYFPLAVGNTWAFKNWNDQTNSFIDTAISKVITITSVQTIQNRLVYTALDIQFNAKGDTLSKSVNYFSACDDTLFMLTGDSNIQNKTFSPVAVFNEKGFHIDKVNINGYNYAVDGEKNSDSTYSIGYSIIYVVDSDQACIFKKGVGPELYTLYGIGTIKIKLAYYKLN